MGVSIKTAIKQGLTMEGVKRRHGSIGNWEALMGLYWGFEGAGMLTSVYSKVTVSVGDCLDQGGIFMR